MRPTTILTGLFTMTLFFISCEERVGPCPDEQRYMQINERDSALIPYTGDSIQSMRYVRTVNGLVDTITLTGSIAEYAYPNFGIEYEGDCQIRVWNSEKIMKFTDLAGEVEMTFRVYTTHNSDFSTIYVQVNTDIYTLTGVYYITPSGDILNKYDRVVIINGVVYDNVLLVNNATSKGTHYFYYNDKYGVLAYGNPNIKIELLTN